MIGSISLRKVIMLAFIVGCGSLVITRAIQRYFFSHESFISLDEEIDRAQLALSQQAGSAESSANVNGGSAGAYDFSTILKLIDLVHAVQGDGKGFADFVPRRRKTDHAEVKTLLEALLREREALRTYIWNLKGLSKVNIPPRRYRALLHYTEVLDGMISEMQELLHR